MQGLRQQVGIAAMVGVSLVLAACSSSRVGGAPVEDRGMGVPSHAAVDAAPPVATAARPAMGEPTVNPGFHMVRPGETLRRIAQDAGQTWKDVVRWNNLENPDRIEVGQILRVAPPNAGSAPVTAGGSNAVLSDNTVATKPIAPSAVAAAALVAPASAAASAPSAARTTAQAVTTPAVAGSGDDAVSFIWPSGGSLIGGFDETKNKGYDISGKAGDAVLASADGRVVYAGAGLRGYGNLIILKHNNTYLTAYAHNQTLLVKDDQTVRKGQKIAEMGNSDADRVKLHFEIRKQGKPVDPSRYLPAK